MRKIYISLIVLLVLGCAKVNVETKKPIKVDINMRIDVYQHVANDVESINDEIYGAKPKSFNSLFDFTKVYAADLSAAAQTAITRRKARAAKIEEYFNKGYIGENKEALIVIRPAAPADADRLAAEENKDRDVLYEYTASNNGVDIAEVRKVFLMDDYQRASAGWWFQIPQGDSYLWQQK